MLNFIKFDISKLLKMKSFWFTLFLMGSLIFALMMLESSELNTSYEDYKKQQIATNEESKKNNLPTFDIKPEEEYNNMNAKIKESMTISSNIPSVAYLAIMAGYIFFAIFVGNDFTSGYLKNMLSIKGAKWKWVTSKIFVAIAFALATFIVGVIVGIASEIRADQFLQPINFAKLAIFFGLHSLMMIIIMMLNVGLMLLIQSKGAVTVISTLMGMGLHVQLLGKLGEVLNFNIIEKLYSSKYQAMGLAFEGQLTNALIAGAITFAILYLFNRFYVYRIDFKFEH